MATLYPLDPLSRQLPRDWGVYDFEWNKSYKLTCLGAYDGQYRSYQTIDEFLSGELGRHRHYWAHAGGLADAVFLIHWLLKRGVAFDIAPVGSAAVFLKALGVTWHDSFFLLRAPLADLGDAVGFAKGHVDFDKASYDELRVYNERDNALLFRVLHEFADLVENLGGSMRSTAAATALDLFRRRFQQAPAYCPPQVGATVRLAYFASDVQNAVRRAEVAFVHDRVSSFPAEMRGPLPWRFLGRRKRLKGEECGFGLATIRIPANTEYPAIPVRAPNGGIYFPTGEIHGWYAQPDIEYASELGYEVQVHEWLVFSPNEDLTRFVETLAPLRIAAKNAGNDFWALALKILINALYGKFGEVPIKSQILFGEATPDSEMLWPGVHQRREARYLAHEQPQVSAWVTSKARIALHRQYSGLAQAGFRVFNWDTDSVFTDAYEVPGQGTHLGGWTREGVIHRPKFRAPKMHSGTFYPEKPSKQLDDGTVTNLPAYRVKAKGVAVIGHIMRDRGLTPARKEELLRAKWRDIDEGRKITYPAMRRFRAVLAGNEVGDYEASKTYRGRFSKRRFLSPDESKAWSIDDVMRMGA